MDKIDNCIKGQSLIVDIDTKIEIEVNGEPQSWEVVRFGESDIPNGKISCQAPLVQYILGASKGDIIRCKVMDRDVVIMVKKVSFS